MAVALPAVSAPANPLNMVVWRLSNGDTLAVVTKINSAMAELETWSAQNNATFVLIDDYVTTLAAGIVMTLPDVTVPTALVDFGAEELVAGDDTEFVTKFNQYMDELEVFAAVNETAFTSVAAVATALASRVAPTLVFTVPAALDFSDENLDIGDDDEFITKMTSYMAEIEAWATATNLAFTRIVDYLAGVDTDINSIPVLTVPAGNVDPSYTVRWTDASPASGRKYAVYLDGVNASGTLSSTFRSYQLTGMSAGSHTVQLRWFSTNTAVYQSATISITVADASRIVSDTVISDITDTGWLASIEFTEGVKLRNYVDTFSPPTTLFSIQNDYETAAHASPVYGKAAGTTYYHQQVAEFFDGTFEYGSITQVVTVVTGQSTPLLTIPSSNISTNYVFKWTDSSPPSGRNYSLWIDGVNVSGTMGSSDRQYSMIGMTDGTKTVILRYFPTATPETYQYVSMTVTVGEASFTARTNKRYVSTTGNDTNDGLTEGNAWASVSGNVGEIVADTEIIFLDGTYDMSTPLIYSAGLPAGITIRAKNSRMAILTGDDTLTDTDDNGIAVYLYSETDFELWGLHFADWQGSQAGVILMEDDVDGFRCSGCKFTNNGTGEFNHIFYFSGGPAQGTTQTNFVITNNEAVMKAGTGAFVQFFSGDVVAHASGPHDGEIAFNTITGSAKWGIVQSNDRKVGESCNINIHDNSFIMTATDSIIQLAAYSGTAKDGVDSTYVIQDNRLENLGAGADAYAVWRYPLISVSGRLEHSPSFSGNTMITNNGEDPLSGITIDGGTGGGTGGGGGSLPYVHPPQFSSVQGSWSANSNGMPAYLAVRTETHADLPSGTTITRVSGSNEYHVYSKRRVFNSDSTLMAVARKIARTSDGAWTGGSVAIGPRNEFNWSNTEPNVIYGIGSDEKSYVKRNVVTGVNTTLRTWSEYSYMTMGDFEGVQSNNDRYVCLTGYTESGRVHVSYDAVANTVLGTKTAETKDNWAGFSQDGNFLMVEKNAYPDTDWYLTIYDKNFNQLRRIVRKPEHGDWAVDRAGNQVYAMLTGPGLNYVIANTGEVVTALTSGLNWGHLSAKNISRPGYVYVSSESSGGPIVEVELAPNGKVALYGLPRTSSSGYNNYAMGCPNNDASMMAYHTDYQGDTITEMLLKLPLA